MRNIFLALLTVLGMLPATAQPACSKEDALGEIDIYSDDTVLDYLSINRAARSRYPEYKQARAEKMELLTAKTTWSGLVCDREREKS